MSKLFDSIKRKKVPVFIGISIGVWLSVIVFLLCALFKIQ